jgi:hypothetical protein
VVGGGLLLVSGGDGDGLRSVFDMLIERSGCEMSSSEGFSCAGEGDMAIVDMFFERSESGRSTSTGVSCVMIF